MSDDELCNFENMYVNSTKRSAALHLVQVISAAQQVGCSSSLADSLAIVRGDDPLFIAFRSNDKVGSALLARADSAVRTSLHQAQAQEASERFNNTISCL